MMELYDRAGKPITLDEYAQLVVDRSYKRVAKDRVGVYEISTVWLGVDHSFGYGDRGSPIIFETMVFAPSDQTLGPELECRRYSTEAEALAGHAEQVLLVRATTQEEPVMDDQKERRDG